METAAFGGGYNSFITLDFIAK